jgi:glycosyltransferase involved in cell wall biosynthesis
MRFHLLALPNVQTTKAYSLDGFCSATIRFAKVLEKIGSEVILYASEENEAPCNELVKVITKEEQKVLLDGIEYQYAGLHNRAYPLWALANNRTIAEIHKRKQPRDLILTIGGTSHKPIADSHPDLMTVEYSIGYVSSFSKYRVYESHYWRAMTHGAQNEWDGRFFDDVIPLFFDPSEFRYNPNPEPFALFVGRVIPKKGIGIVCEACRQAGIPLKVIGHGDPSLVTYGEYLGTLPDTERNEWMANASVLLAPTTYVEPFGSTVVEAAMCGTPAITTDFGAFVETVEHGVTGFRCRYLGEFVQAIRRIREINRSIVARRANEKYSLDAVVPQYAAYFNRLELLWSEGFNSLT